MEDEQGGKPSDVGIWSLGVYPLHGKALANWIMGWKQRRKMVGDRVSPWNTPCFTENRSVFQVLLWVNAFSWLYAFVTYEETAFGTLTYFSISLISWWDIEPKALLRSRKVIFRASQSDLAFSRIAVVARICSMVPLIPVRKPFWVV